MSRQTIFPPIPDTLKNRIVYARENGISLSLLGLDLEKNKELDESQAPGDFFRDVLIPYPLTHALQKYLKDQESPSLLTTAIPVITNPNECKSLKKELRRIKIKVHEKLHSRIHADIFEARQQIDELDISDSVLIPVTWEFLKSSKQVQTVLISAKQYAENPDLNIDSIPANKFFITGTLTPDQLKSFPFTRQVHLSIPFVDRMYDDLNFTHCKFHAEKIQFALHYPASENSTKVEVDVQEFIDAYNRKFHANKCSVLEILSIKNEADRKTRQTFIEEYCFHIAIEKKIPFSFEDASYFFDKYPPSRLSNVIFATDVFNLVQDKISTQKKSLIDNGYNARRQVLAEAKKNKALLLGLPNQLTSDTFIAEINKGHRFFRGVTVTGDVDLSQLKNKDLSKLDIGNVTFQGKFDASHCILTRANCQGTVFNRNVIFTSTDIRDVNFHDTRFNANFYISQETKAEKSSAESGFIFGLSKKNNNTHIHRVMFSLGKNKPEIRFTYNAQSTKICVTQNELVQHMEADQTKSFLNEFEKQYLHVCKQRAPHYSLFQRFKNLFRDNMIEKLKKLTLNDAEKLHFLLQHVSEKPGSRAAFALRETIREDRFSQAVSHFVALPEAEKLLSAEEALKKNLLLAKKLLDTALSTFQNTYLFGNDNNSPTAHENRKKEQDKIIAAYLLIKAEGGAHAIAHYDQLIKNVIYPSYLHYALSPVTIRQSATKKFRYNLAEELFIISSSVRCPDHLAIVSEKRDEVAGGPAFFIRKEAANSREIFEDECLKRWSGLSLTTLKDAGLLDLATFQIIQEKISGCIEQGQSRLSIERIFYLGELIKQEKYDEAKREAQVIKSFYASSLKNSLLNEIFSLSIAALKNKIVDESKTLAASQVSYDEFRIKINVLETGWRNKLNPLADIRHILFSDSMVEHYNVIHAASDGLRNTFALKTIAESVLSAEQFNHALLLQLAPRENNVSHPCVWVSSDAAKKQLCDALFLVSEEEKIRGNTNLSRIDLLAGLSHCIQKLAPISVFLTSNPTPTILSKADVAFIYRGVLGTQYATQLLKNALEGLWKYSPIQKAINRFSEGEILSFRDPTHPNTQSLIDDPAVNFFKYKHVVDLHAELQSIQRQLNIETVFSDKDYHGKITQQFSQMIRHIEAVRKDIRDNHPSQIDKGFDKLIFDNKTGAGILAEVINAKTQWMEYCFSVNGDLNLSRRALTI